MGSAEMKEVLIVAGLLYGLGLVVSLVTYLKRPEKINGLFGYRTGTSMKNQRNWDFANRLFPKYFFLETNIVTAFSLGLVWLLRKHLGVEGAVLMTGLFHSIGAIWVIALIEIKLTKFDEQQS